MSKGKNFTVRLSDEDQDVLDRLAQAFDTDRSATVRRALRIALHNQQALPLNNGIFTPAHTPHTPMNVHLDAGDDDE